MATELAKAYVQIVPSTRGVGTELTRQLGGELPGAGESAGNSLAAGIKSALAKAAIGKMVADTIKEAFSEGAALQQSIGGIETLFKESASIVRQYADDAFQTAGLSANQYMETVTSFSASLLQSLGGNTRAAAEIANQAIIDMADNSNKFGTDMQSIQNAFQGFAKQNYTMLDNLKLGYGGTKSEMERLLADAEKLSGIHYDISNLSDVYSAIHVIQQELNVTGTTAEEASKTFTGSFAAMKAAAKNLLGKLTLGEDIGPALESLKETVVVFLRNNLFPMIGNLIRGLFGQEVYSAVSFLAEVVLEALQAIAAFVNWLNGGSTSAKIFKVAIVAITAAVLAYKGTLLALKIAEIAAAAAQMALNVAMSMNPVGLVVAAVAALVVIIVALIVNLGDLKEWFGKIGNAISKFISGIPSSVSQFFRRAWDTAKRWVQKFVEIGRDIVFGIWEGIKSVWDWMVEKWNELWDSLFGGIKKMLGIHSPSTLYAGIGKNMALGIDKGWEDAFDGVKDDIINSLAVDSFTVAMRNTQDLGNQFDPTPQITEYARRTKAAPVSAVPVKQETRGSSREPDRKIIGTVTFSGTDQQIIRALAPKLDLYWQDVGTTG